MQKSTVAYSIYISNNFPWTEMNDETWWNYRTSKPSKLVTVTGCWEGMGKWHHDPATASLTLEINGWFPMAGSVAGLTINGSSKVPRPVPTFITSSDNPGGKSGSTPVPTTLGPLCLPSISTILGSTDPSAADSKPWPPTPDPSVGPGAVRFAVTCGNPMACPGPFPVRSTATSSISPDAAAVGRTLRTLTTPPSPEADALAPAVPDTLSSLSISPMISASPPATPLAKASSILSAEPRPFLTKELSRRRSMASKSSGLWTRNPRFRRHRAVGPFLWAWAKAYEMSLVCYPCCRGHAILHDSYTLLHVMLCILAAGAMLFFTIATPFCMSCYASLLQGPCYSSR